MVSKKKSALGKYDLVIRGKGTGSRILEIGQAGVRFESSSKGPVRGKLYSGTHWDTVESTMQADGTAQFNVKYIQMTNKGEMVMGTGVGTQQTADSKGIAKFTGGGTMWTSSSRLSNLNGGRWSCEGEYNMIKETAEVRVKFDTSIVA
jgi:hypothetical protein